MAIFPGFFISNKKTFAGKWSVTSMKSGLHGQFPLLCRPRLMILFGVD